jgi:hypothetical protein
MLEIKDFEERFTLIHSIEYRLNCMKETRHNYYLLSESIDDNPKISQEDKDAKFNCLRNQINNINEKIDLAIELKRRIENLI